MSALRIGMLLMCLIWSVAGIQSAAETYSRAALYFKHGIEGKLRVVNVLRSREEALHAKGMRVGSKRINKYIATIDGSVVKIEDSRFFEIGATYDVLYMQSGGQGRLVDLGDERKSAQNDGNIFRNFHFGKRESSALRQFLQMWSVHERFFLAASILLSLWASLPLLRLLFAKVEHPKDPTEPW